MILLPLAVLYYKLDGYENSGRLSQAAVSG